MLATLEEVFGIAVHYLILILECIGVVVIVISTVRSIPVMIRDSHKGHMILTDGIMTALNFLLGSEVLKTIVAPDWKDIGMTCAILAMRAGVTVLVHWENKGE